MSEEVVNPSRQMVVEWPTLALAFGCYALFAICLFVLPIWAAIVVLAPVIALHASLTHEVVHGHPFASAHLNAALVFPALTLTVPFARFKATHLAHHRDEYLTDPYDDPESNYMDPNVWVRLPRPVQALLRFNNRLVGRLLIGPLLGQLFWMASDLRAARAGDRAVLRGWLWHLPAAALVLAVVWAAPLPIWAYLVAAYGGHALLRLRTYLEHQAHDLARARTVIVEDKGPLALLFLNNNLHVVHHMHPKLPWYELPRLYDANRSHYLRRNEGYRFASYASVIRRHFWRAKDPVPHPLRPHRDWQPPAE